jgi:hypothetical protein
MFKDGDIRTAGGVFLDGDGKPIKKQKTESSGPFFNGSSVCVCVCGWVCVMTSLCKGIVPFRGGEGPPKTNQRTPPCVF